MEIRYSWKEVLAKIVNLSVSSYLLNNGSDVSSMGLGSVAEGLIMGFQKKENDSLKNKLNRVLDDSFNVLSKETIIKRNCINS